MKIEVQRVFAENFGVYGVRKDLAAVPARRLHGCPLHRRAADGEPGLQGAVRGKPVWTTISDKAVPCPLDHVNRQFHALTPNALWVSDFTYVATWAGFVHVAFVAAIFDGAREPSCSVSTIVGNRADRCDVGVPNEPQGGSQRGSLPC